MKEINFSTSACRYCRFYEPEGRRGGSCQILGVSVDSSWQACNFASSPFETTLKKLENIFQLETSIALDSPERILPQVIDRRTRSQASPGFNTQGSCDPEIEKKVSKKVFPLAVPKKE